MNFQKLVNTNSFSYEPDDDYYTKWEMNQETDKKIQTSD